MKVAVLHNHPIHYKHLLFHEMKKAGIDFRVFFLASQSSLRHEKIPLSERLYSCEIGFDEPYESTKSLARAWFAWNAISKYKPDLMIISGFHVLEQANGRRRVPDRRVVLDEVHQGKRPDADIIDLASEAALAAVADAQVTMKDIGILAYGNLVGQTQGQMLQKQIGQTGIPVYNVANACATGATALRTAIMAITRAMPRAYVTTSGS